MNKSGRAIEKYQPLWGSWEVEELIGQGSSSEVYRVFKEEWGKRYISTVKFLSFSIGKSDFKEAQSIGIDTLAIPEYLKNMVGNIQNEIDLMYRLRGNSNIVTYEDHKIYEKKGNSGWDVLIRMESLQSLPDFILERGLGRLEAAKLGIDICKALEACAREDIVHRDIKDSSIFVSAKGEFKLGSFSMAKELWEGGRTALTALNPLYMAPELYKEQQYDFSVDIYSLGIVMYKLLNRGRLPFLSLTSQSITVDDTERSVARRMAGEKLPLPVDAGDSLGAMILKACSYDKKNRYRSPYKFREKLERFIKAETKSKKCGNLLTKEVYTYASVGYKAAQAATASQESRAGKEREELERAAVAEVAAAVNILDTANRHKRRKLVSKIIIGVAAVILVYFFIYK
jgi:serine/threonine protein kinase